MYLNYYHTSQLKTWSGIDDTTAWWYPNNSSTLSPLVGAAKVASKKTLQSQPFDNAIVESNGDIKLIIL